MNRDRRPRGASAFLEQYAGLYGPRWGTLLESLTGPADSVAFRASAESEPYFLDSASLFAAQCLILPALRRGAAQESGTASSAAGSGPALVLDACAAPGGKSLVLASRMAAVCGPDALLQSNELSANRRRRLAAVLDRHLPPAMRSRVEVLGRDAASLCRTRREVYDAILLDAPCSSERHVLADARALEEWSPARSRNLAARQWALLSSAFLMLKPGGCLVYSTCSLAPQENQGVVARLEGKYGGEFDFDPPEDGRCERAGAGMLMLPDRAGGAGPMFVCRLSKRLQG